MVMLAVRVVVVFDVVIAHGLTFPDIFPHLSLAAAADVGRREYLVQDARVRTRE